ncbi:MAG: sulfatase [Capsulimonadaceae bacterium]|nr:sulfatase [Capsulimonadaceae bacterium]
MTNYNILYLHSHDTGRAIQPYGYGVATPHLQRFAEQGVLFRQAFCAGPTCSPSRAGLLTGTYPHVNGMLGLAHRGFGLKDYKQHLARVFGEAGYETALAGMQHEAGDVRAIGYEHVLPTRSSAAADVVPHAVEFLARTHDRPFFLSAGFFETHRPFPTPEIDPRFVKPPAPIADTESTRRDMAGFATSAQRMDEGYGLILAALDRSGLADKTIVIITTDHGPAFPGMKCNLTDHGIGVLLMVRGPGGFEGGRVIDAAVTHLDLFPTLCDLAGIDKPARLQGKSLLPLVRGDVTNLHERIVAEVNFHAAYEPQRCVRTSRYKYIRRFASRTSPVLPNCDAGESKDLWLSAGWRKIAPEDEQLYDLILDPNEVRNLVGDASAASELSAMRLSLREWMEQTSDPLLDGPLMIPAGAALDDVDALDPDEKVTRYKTSQRAE